MMRSIFALAATIPALSMVAAHYLPWGKALGRPLHRLEAYAVGTLAITGTSATLLLASDDNDEMRPRHAAATVVIAAFSAGGATLLAWLADWALEEHHLRLDAEYKRNAQR